MYQLVHSVHQGHRRVAHQNRHSLVRFLQDPKLPDRHDLAKLSFSPIYAYRHIFYALLAICAYA